jgi:hypothetical protein
LTQRGRAEMAERHAVAALEMWNRVLTIDPANGEVLALVDGISRRRRIGFGLGLGLGVALLGLSAAAAFFGLVRPAGHASATAKAAAPAPDEPLAHAPAAPPAPSPAPPVTAALTPPPAHLEPAPAAIEDATPVLEVVPPHELTRRPPPHPEVPRHLDSLVRPSAPAALGASRLFHLVPSPKSATYSVDGGPFQQIDNGSVDVALGPGRHTIVTRNPICDDFVEKIEPAEAGRAIIAKMPFKPTQVVARCKDASVISINDRPVVNGTVVEINSFHQGSKEAVRVDFLIAGQTRSKTVMVTAGDPRTEVQCDGP